MQLKMQTDYAIRIMLYLSIVDRIASLKEISQAMGIAETYCPKIIKQLMTAEMITSEPGKDGGYRLKKKPNEVNLLSIMETMEDSVRYNRCLEEDEFCSRNATDNCEVHQIYKRYQEMTEEYFSRFTLEIILKQSS